jgi:hypothetical protein
MVEAGLSKHVLDMTSRDPGTSTRKVTAAVGVSHQSIWRFFQNQLLCPYHMQQAQALLLADHPQQVVFREWYLQLCIAPNFQQCVLLMSKQISHEKQL